MLNRYIALDFNPIAMKIGENIEIQSSNRNPLRPSNHSNNLKIQIQVDLQILIPKPQENCHKERKSREKKKEF